MDKYPHHPFFQQFFFILRPANIYRMGSRKNAVVDMRKVNARFVPGTLMCLPVMSEYIACHDGLNDPDCSVLSKEFGNQP